ncbi:hypothetical protein SUNI508_12917 [Seiridium unicorne]|uniref:Uncharacterized protein n=1 Tax=Seiridium unicorne TaxID=138068 RepID=A0ABR2VFW9_9PEZI
MVAFPQPELSQPSASVGSPGTSSGLGIIDWCDLTAEHQRTQSHRGTSVSGRSDQMRGRDQGATLLETRQVWFSNRAFLTGPGRPAMSGSTKGRGALEVSHLSLSSIRASSATSDCCAVRIDMMNVDVDPADLERVHCP